MLLRLRVSDGRISMFAEYLDPTHFVITIGTWKEITLAAPARIIRRLASLLWSLHST